MARIQIADLRAVEAKSQLIAVKDDEQNAVKGGGLGTFLSAIAQPTADLVLSLLS